MSTDIPGSHMLVSTDTLLLMLCTLVLGIAFIYVLCLWVRVLDWLEDMRIERKRRMRLETP